MPTFKDLTGQKFGKLTVIELSRKVQSGTRERFYWKCQCECGNEKEIRTDSLTSGRVQSCGCIKKEQDKINLTKFHRHKMSNTHIWHTYYAMLHRCNNQDDKRFKNYGGRGITVCDEWKNSFDNFLKWSMENGYEEHLQIDRIDNDGNYEPDNCRWVTRKENCRNRRSNIIVEYKGKQMTLIELSELTGINYGCLFRRYKRGNRDEYLVRPIKK